LFGRDVPAEIEHDQEAAFYDPYKPRHEQDECLADLREPAGIARDQTIEEIKNVIDTNTEWLILLREVPNRLPRRLSGKRVHWGTCYRWANRGLRGVHLESVTIGGDVHIC
jgi:hypothetical protein